MYCDSTLYIYIFIYQIVFSWGLKVVKKHRAVNNSINLLSFSKDYPEVVKIYKAVKKTKSLLYEKVKDKTILQSNKIDDEEDIINTSNSYSIKHRQILKHFDEITTSMKVEEYLVYSEQRCQGFSNSCKKEFSKYLDIKQGSIMKLLNYLFIQQYYLYIYIK